MEVLMEYKKVVERKIRRVKRRIADYEESGVEKLSVHGHWSLGYFKGSLYELENILDDIEEALSSTVVIDDDMLKKVSDILVKYENYDGYRAGVEIYSEVIKEKISRFDKFDTDGWDTEKWMRFITRECLFDTYRIEGNIDSIKEKQSIRKK